MKINIGNTVIKINGVTLLRLAVKIRKLIRQSRINKYNNNNNKK
jgi:hypothetical protein